MKIEPNGSKRSVCRIPALAAFGLIILFGPAHSTLAQWTTSGNNINNTNTGNVGVGTTNPTEKLQISGTVKSSGGLVLTGAPAQPPNVNGLYLGIDGTTATIDAVEQMVDFRDLVIKNKTFRVQSWNGALVTGLFQNNAGNVGIGTSSPGNKLSVNGSAVFGGSVGSSGEAIEVQGAGSGVALKDRNGTSPRWVFYPSGGVFHLYNDTLGNALSVNVAGNVGIGTGPSSNKLEVSGNLNASGEITGGTLKAKYQDVAEWVESSQSLAAGTVVVLDHTKSNQVVASTEAYDTRVAGVISAQPGITLGESGAARVLVATTGRVRMKVDATQAPIQVGDLLVTGEREGFAMKSLPVNIGGVQLHRPGTLVGKALEPLAKGTGEILVLLSLQ